MAITSGTLVASLLPYKGVGALLLNRDNETYFFASLPLLDRQGVADGLTWVGATDGLTVRG